LHTPETQSTAPVHGSPTAHLSQDPPQSVLLSLPFFAPSWQLGGRHDPGAPEHTALAQSPEPEHALPGAHGRQLPPQSRSLSRPFRTTSEQVGSWQMLFRHTELRQSAALLQPAPAGQSAQLPPPQSTSVSNPLCTESLHKGSVHVPAAHKPLSQSLPRTQLWLVSQRRHV
jgi:hypothetical protein